MRKISKQAAEAFKKGFRFKSGNTEVNQCNTGSSYMFLHGNLIASFNPGTCTLQTTLAGWNTPTTRERLNTLRYTMEVDGRYTQKGFEAYFNDELIDSESIQLITITQRKMS